jgi:hypothetical protein
MALDAENGGLSLVRTCDVAGEFTNDDAIIRVGKRIGAVVTVFHIQYPKLSAIMRTAM